MEDTGDGIKSSAASTAWRLWQSCHATLLRYIKMSQKWRHYNVCLWSRKDEECIFENLSMKEITSITVMCWLQKQVKSFHVGDLPAHQISTVSSRANTVSVCMPEIVCGSIERTASSNRIRRWTKTVAIAKEKVACYCQCHVKLVKVWRKISWVWCIRMKLL